MAFSSWLFNSGIADSLFFSSSKMESFENIGEGIMALGRKPEFPDLMGEKLCWSVDPVNVPGLNGQVGLTISSLGLEYCLLLGDGLFYTHDLCCCPFLCCISF